MRRLKEEFLEKVETLVLYKEAKVLEIGCGTGSRSVAIADKCLSLEAIDPDTGTLNEAKKINSRPNINYKHGIAESLQFGDDEFDTTIFTLSLHHVPIGKMNKAISEAVRVTKNGGFVVFLEPVFNGSYFDSEILFDAGCGDERAEKARAYYEMLNFKDYTEVVELRDETIFKFDSAEDYIETFKPKRNIKKLEEFLDSHKYKLNAKRRINVFRV